MLGWISRCVILTKIDIWMAEAEVALKLAQDDHRAGESAVRTDKRGG